tara:strand:- start:3273 stop:4127 length:855 start_codon:yes stop_codon:yes gene_type:complete
MPKIRSVVQAVSQSAATRVDGVLRTIGLAKKFGASGAYSFRDIGADGGPVVNVTRSSDTQRQDFTAAEITNGTLEAFVGAGNNGTIKLWYDQSGNGLHLNGPSLVSKEPTLVSNGTLVTDNGKPALSCNVNEYFTLLGTGTTVVAKAFYLVLNVTSAESEVARDIMGMRSGSTNFMRFRNDDKEQVKWNGEGHIFDLTAEDQQIIVSVDIDSSNLLRYFEDGQQSGTTKSGSTGNFQMQRFLMRATNASENFKGKVSEAIFFDSDKTAERTEITNLINAHYGVF